MPAELISHLQQQRRGFEFFGKSENPKLHERVLGMQKALLEHLMHVNTQNRLIENGLMGSGYSLAEMMADLSTAVMLGEAEGEVINTLRQNLQLDYVERLIRVLDNSRHMQVARSVALFELGGIRSRLEREREKVPLSNRPHVEHVLFKIEQALELKW